MQCARAMHIGRQQLGFAVVVGRHGSQVLVQRLGGGFGVGHHERQLEGFRLGEAARAVAGQGPDDVHYAVLYLVVQLGRCSAELHARVALKLDATTGLFFHLLHPGFVHGEPHIGHGCHEGMELERDALLGKAHDGG